MSTTSSKFEFKIRENVRQSSHLGRRPFVSFLTKTKGESPASKAKPYSSNIYFAKNVQDSLMKMKSSNMGIRLFISTVKPDRTASKFGVMRLSSFEVSSPKVSKDALFENHVTADQYESLINLHLRNIQAFVKKRDDSCLGDS